jgi:hypothetical protein
MEFDYDPFSIVREPCVYAVHPKRFFSVCSSQRLCASTVQNEFPAIYNCVRDTASGI